MLCVLEQGWNKTLQGCGPLGTEFNTPGLGGHLSRPVFFKPVLEAPLPCIFCMYPLFDTSKSGLAVSINELMTLIRCLR